jgi:hypothetical protein
MPAARVLVVIAFALAATLVASSQAAAREQVLTLYSPRLVSQPYVHKTYDVDLRPDGIEAPKQPGAVLGFAEEVVVDSKDPKARPLPIGKMMVHHLLYFAPGRVDQGPGGCGANYGYLTGRGEEHPDGRFGAYWTPQVRKSYGITNRTADGGAPAWHLTAMVMNHYKRVKAFYVRTRIWYTTEPRTPIYPVLIGNCAQLANGMAYDVPGGGPPGSDLRVRGNWTVPAGFNGRIIGAHAHQHGGAKYVTLDSQTCRRRLMKARAYYGLPDHIYNTIRPILHEPGPIANGTFSTMQGIPVHGGEVLTTTAVHDDHNLHVAAMGSWTLMMISDPSASQCGPMPTDLNEIDRPRAYDPAPNFDLRVPQLAPPGGRLTLFPSAPLTVTDGLFAPGRVVVRRGRPITWRFAGAEPHSVTVANGPRGFSSLYSGSTSGTFTFTPRVRGVYRLVCLIHPTTMGQTVDVR